MVHSLNKDTHGGNIMIKVDMAKAYDRVDWNFLLEVFRCFGFSLSFCDLIRACISNIWYYVLLNGTMRGFFQGGRGLRQGDRLLPYLFIIIKEVLSRLLKQSVSSHKIGNFSQPRGTPQISHLMYADDIMIFLNGGKKSVRELLLVFEKYEIWSGQMINKEKTDIFFS